MIKILLAIGLGGGLGSIARFLVQNLLSHFFKTDYPLGTFTVNIVGCFLIGIFYAIAAKEGLMAEVWRMFLIVGFCGGFTTFSSFSYDGIRLINEGHTFLFILYATLSVFLGLLAAWGGWAIMK